MRMVVAPRKAVIAGGRVIEEVIEEGEHTGPPCLSPRDRLWDGGLTGTPRNEGERG